jgi:hypothetical protein
VFVANKGNIVVDVDHEETSIAVFAEAYRRGGFYWDDIDALHVLGDTDLVEPDEGVEAEYLIPPHAHNGSPISRPRVNRQNYF